MNLHLDWLLSKSSFTFQSFLLSFHHKNTEALLELATGVQFSSIEHADDSVVETSNIQPPIMRLPNEILSKILRLGEYNVLL